MEIKLMRRILLIVILSVVIPSSDFGQTNATADARAEQDIKKLADEYRANMLNRNVDALARLYAEDMIITGNNGQARSKASYIEALKANSNKIKYDSWEIENMVIHIYGNTAVSNQIVVAKGRDKNGEFNTQSRSTATYVKLQDRWQIVAVHISTVKPQP